MHLTNVPDSDLALDPLVSLRVDSRSPFPLSIAVPVRVSTVRQIAQTAQMPMQGAIQCFLQLLSRGIVELTGLSQSNQVPNSGAQSRSEAPPLDVDEDDFF